MAKGRMVNKSISLSLKLDALPDDTCRLLATWTMPQLDFRGVFYGDAAAVRSLVFPLRPDITTDRVDAYLEAMADVGLIRFFNSGGRRWQHWPGFEHNQAGIRIERERSDFPVPPKCRQDAADSTECPRIDDAKMSPDCRQNDAEKPAEVNLNLTELNLTEQKGSALPPKIPEIAIPETKPAEIVTPEVKSAPEVKPSRPRDPLFDAIAEVTASNVTLLGSRIGKITTELRKIDATPELVRKVAAWYAQNDWRGKKGEKLTFEVLKEVWLQGVKGAPIIATGKTSRRPQIADRTESERAESIAKAGERNAARSVGANERLQAQLIQARADRDRAVKRQDTSATNYFDQQIASLESKLVAERMTA